MRRLIIGLVFLLAALLLANPVSFQKNYRDFIGEVTKKEAVPEKVRLYRHATGEIITLPLEEYLVGVVAAEMPAAFPPEALKAQAVCARTYILKRLTVQGGSVNNPHPEADICDDPRHGQAWYSREDLKQRWGTLDYYRFYYKVYRAVASTRGTVLVHKGELIDPVYHSSCGGATESAGDVWKFDLPYLRSVPCPYDHDPYPGETKSFTLEQVDAALGTKISVLPVITGVGDIVQVLEYTSTGRPKLLSFGNTEVSATVVRDRLGLRSTNFTFTYKNGKLVYTTTGNGHGVGLCQYGAKGLAEHGRDFRAILQHYYTGVTIKKLE
ncbi:stage II sporulation protein D [Desulforudis sp. 1088]|uniref:stage II sporulation protein D n=1 Tax=unclassified Candidatus Desulforudis TaxID=2635950 RepID=UPI003CE47DA2